MTHTYADGPAAPTITVDLVDEDGTHTAAGSLGLTVSNVAPEAVIDSIVDDAGQVVGTDTGAVLVGLDAALTGSFSDAGAVDTHTATIDWGDGNVTDLGAVAPSDVAATHAYSAVGTYTIALTVTDDDGGTGVATFDLPVLDPAEVIQGLTDELDDLANDPDITPEAAEAVTDALEELEGKNGGMSASGALDKIEAGNLNAALVKMIKAIWDLKNAEAADPGLDLTALKQAIALTAKSLAVYAITQAEATAVTPQDYEKLAAAQAFLADGQDLLGQNEFVSAVQAFQDVFKKVAAMIN